MRGEWERLVLAAVLWLVVGGSAHAQYALRRQDHRQRPAQNGRRDGKDTVYPLDIPKPGFSWTSSASATATIHG
jgi:hypothetical protein